MVIRDTYIGELNLHDIAMRCNHRSTFEKGMLYYRAGNLINLAYRKDMDIIIAIVRGNEYYQVAINLDERGERILQVSCSCPDSIGHSGYCKHVVAVLLKIYYDYEKVMQPCYRPMQEIVDYFDHYHAAPVPANFQELQLEYTLQVIPASDYQQSHRSLTLKLGEKGKQLYVVQNVANFLHACAREETLRFGKSLTFDPRLHYFNETDQAVMDLLLEMYEWHQSLSRGTSNGSMVIRKKEIFFTTQTFKRLLGILKDHGVEFHLKLGHRYFFKNLRAVEGPVPLRFDLRLRDDYLCLGIQGEEMLAALLEDGSYWFYRDKVYRMPEEQLRPLVPFYNEFIRAPERELIMDQAEQAAFFQELLPHLEEAGPVEIKGNKLKKAVERNPLQARVYLDYQDETVTAQVYFYYGEQAIDPLDYNGIFNAEAGDGDKVGDTALDGKEKLQGNGRYQVRDKKKEKTVLDLLYRAGFSTGDGVLQLSEEERLVELLQEILPSLQEVAEVYYSDSFRRLSMRPAPRATCRLGMKRENNLLEMQLGLEGIDQRELAEVWKSWKEKKKYHRLRDGSLLPLEDEGLRQLEETAAAMDLSAEELQGPDRDKIELHRGHALHLESAAHDGRIPNLQWSGEIKKLLETVRELQQQTPEVPASLRGVLREYQVTGFRWMKSLARAGLGGVLADDMGLGKTLQALALILSEKVEKEEKEKKEKKKNKEKKKSGNFGPVLVVAPTSVLYNWEAEAKKFAPGLNTVVIAGPAKERKKLLDQAEAGTPEGEGYDLLITSYSLLRRDIERFASFTFSYCFLDEAQNAKNPRSQTAEAIKRLNAGSTFALTGTPMENSLVELWSIFNCVMPGYLPPYKKFIRKYSRAESGQEEEKQDTARQLSAKVRPFILRRVKEDVLKELPEKIEQSSYCELTAEQKKIYAAYLQRLREEVSEELQYRGFEKSRIKILAGLTRLRQICCHPALFLEDYRGKSAKMEQLLEILQDCRQRGNRVLLFSQFTGMLELIAGNLRSEGYSYFYLDGSVKTEDRLEKAQKFNGGEGEVFLISLKAGGTGLNLTGADVVIQYDLWWNPAVEEQAAGRAHRMGQEKVVQVIKMLTRGTIEEKIFELQQEKKDLVERVVHPGETLLTSLSEEELRQVLEL